MRRYYRRRTHIPMSDGERPVGELFWRGDEIGMEAIAVNGESIGAFPTRYEAASALWRHYQLTREAVRRRK